MTCSFEILEVFCWQNLIASHGSLHRTTWSIKYPLYTLSHGLLFISCIEKIYNFSIASKILQTGFWNWKRDVVTTCRSHDAKLPFSSFFHNFHSTESLLFHSKPWFSKTNYIYYNVPKEWESTFTLGLNAAKSTECIEKCFKQKLYKICAWQVSKAQWLRLYYVFQCASNFKITRKREYKIFPYLTLKDILYSIGQCSFFFFFFGGR